MAGFSAYTHPNNTHSTSRQQSNFLSRKDGQTLVVYRSNVFITLDDNTIIEDSFKNTNGNQDFSSAAINSTVSAIRNKQSSPPPAPVPVPAPAPAINTVSISPNQYNAGIHGTLMCVICKRIYPCPPPLPQVYCEFCEVISYRH